LPDHQIDGIGESVMLYSCFAANSAEAFVRDKRRLVFKLAGAGLIGAAIAGCADKPVKPVVSQIQLTVTAAADVNPDAHNRPSPVSARVYALKSSTIFESADFFSLYDKDTATLGQDVIRQEELLLRPGDNKSIDMTLPPEARVLAVLVAFRDLEHARWRAVRLIEIGKPSALHIKATGRQVTID
jgi:type VI secretion system protein VasD